MRKMLIALGVLSGLMLSQSAFAGLYADDLSKCLVASTTQQDRMALVRWLFSAASLHPAVKSIVTVSEKQLDESTKQTAQLFMRLLTVSCKPQAEKALQYEGPVTIELSFRVLGQVAGRELFTSPEVAVAMSKLQKYVDQKKIAALANKKQ